jgi:cellulose synthase/poly-beta-1,6-N-acetylglucosamine synthase-like glycosyltransferase
MSDSDLLALALRHSLRYRSLRGIEPDPRLLLYVPRELCERATVAPIAVDGNVLTVASATPDPDLSLLTARFPALEIELVLAPAARIAALAKSEPAPRADDEAFYRRLAGHAGLQFAVLDPAVPGHLDANPLAGQLLSEQLCRHFLLLPVGYRDGIVTVALSDPFDELALEVTGALAASGVQPIVAAPADIEAAIARTFGPLRPPRVDDLGPAPIGAPRVGDLLVANGATTGAAVEAALREQERTGSRLGEILLHTGEIDASDLVAALAAQFAMPALDPDSSVDVDAVRALPEELARDLGLAPIGIDGHTLYVATDDALDASALRTQTGRDVVGYLAPARRVEEILEDAYREDHLRHSLDDLRERAPESSAVRVITGAQAFVLTVLGIAAVVGLVFATRATAVVLVALASVFYLATSLYKFRLIFKALGHAYEIETTPEEIAALDERELPVYTILVPLYREASVLPALTAAIESLDYPRTQLDVLLLCEEDDPETPDAIRALNLPPHFRLVIVPDSQPKTKPKACNYGLTLARGEVTVIFDAEDRPDPDQLKKAIVAFSKAPPEVICLQAKLNYYNPTQNLLTRWFTTEYSMWFELLLPGLDADRAPIPLGGTSNHFITEHLRALGAWDPYNVTEDADLGIRLHAAGYRTGMIDSTTLEEANSQVGNWIRQRSRWIKGYLQTYLVHMRHPLRLLRQAGLGGFLAFQLLVGGTVVFLLNPIFWALTALLFVAGAGFVQQMFPTYVFYVAALLLFVGNFLFVYVNVAGSLQRRQFALAKYALLSPLYWGLMSIAAWKALIQLIRSPFYWEKTSHGLDKVA